MGFNKENSYYLLVGVGKREKDSEAMAVSAKDADYLKRAFKAFDLFEDEKIAPLINEEATKSGILEKLDFLVKSTKNKSADLVIIFFSGHGSKIGDNYYLICRDTTSADITNTAIEGSVFVEKLKKIQCDKMLVLLDCCHAEGITDTDIPPMTEDDIPFDEKSFIAFKNRVILTACAKGQVSYLSNPVSLFTYAVIETLGGKWLEEKEKEVNIFNLAMNVRERVVALSKDALKLDEPQRPQLNVLPRSQTTNFALAYYPLGGRQEVRLLEKELSSIKSHDKKEIDLTVAKGRDEEEREKFKWMLTSISVQISDKGINLKESNGNNINFNNGISEDALNVILNGLQERDRTIERLLTMLEGQTNPAFRQLLVKVKNVESSSTGRNPAKNAATQQVFATVEEQRIRSAGTGIESMSTRLVEIENKLSPDNNAKFQLDVSTIEGFKNKIITQLTWLNNTGTETGLNELKRVTEIIREQIAKQRYKVTREFDKQQQQAVADDRIGDPEFEAMEQFMQNRITNLDNFLQQISSLDLIRSQQKNE